MLLMALIWFQNSRSVTTCTWLCMCTRSFLAQSALGFCASSQMSWIVWPLFNRLPFVLRRTASGNGQYMYGCMLTSDLQSRWHIGGIPQVSHSKIKQQQSKNNSKKNVSSSVIKKECHFILMTVYSNVEYQWVNIDQRIP